MIKPKILIIDDDHSILEVLRFILEPEGYDVETTPDAKRLFARKDHFPNLILLDLSLLGESGGNICRKLKQNPKTKKIPVVLLSAHSPEHLKEEARSAKADAFLPKPFDIEILKAVVKKYYQPPVLPGS